MDEEIIERVRYWRAKTFTNIRNAITQTERPADSQVISLLSALNADIALKMAWDELVRSHRRVDKLQSIPVVQSLDDIIARGPNVQEPEQLISKLESYLKALTPTEKSIENLSMSLRATIEALKKPYASHPINQFNGGSLVPSEMEIAGIDRQVTEERGNP